MTASDKSAIYVAYHSVFTTQIPKLQQQTLRVWERLIFSGTEAQTEIS